jgi:hypothetical protein
VSDARKALGLAGAGAASMPLGLALNPFIPINKQIWTGSFVLFSGGLVCWPSIAVLVDRPLALEMGTHFGAGLRQRCCVGIRTSEHAQSAGSLFHFHDANGRVQTLRGVIFQGFAHWTNPYNASLAYALLFVVSDLGNSRFFYTKEIFLRL